MSETSSNPAPQPTTPTADTSAQNTLSDTPQQSLENSSVESTSESATAQAEETTTAPQCSITEDCCSTTTNTATKAEKAATADYNWAMIALRLWVATFCLINGIVKFQTENPAGGADIFDPNAWSGGIVEGVSNGEGSDSEEIPSKTAVWSGQLTAPKTELVAKGWRLANGMKQYGGPILNNPLWSSSDPEKFDLITTYTKLLPWLFLITGIAVLLGVTRRLAPFVAASICLSLASGLWSMYQGTGAEAVLPLMPGFLPAILLVAFARYNPLCAFPKL